ncbi:MAG: AMP-binding protein [Clostridia bacterium]|nr:AMP-binding protein [Clostridia bacterium]
MKSEKKEFIDYKNVKEIIKDAVSKYPDCVAFTIKNKNGKNVSYKKITYKELNEDINAFGTALLSIGLKGKRVAIIGKNRYEWILSYVTILNGVGIAIPLDKGLPEQEIITSLQRSKADIIIFEENMADLMKKIKDENTTNLKTFILMDNIEKYDFLNIPKLIEKGKEEVKKGNKEYTDAEIDNNKMSVILFTSGTTSLAKAVMISHRNIASNVAALRYEQPFCSTDTNIAFLPFHHMYGSTCILLMISAGVNNVFCDGLRHIQENLKEYKVSVFVCVPLILEAMHKKIMNTIDKTGQRKKFEFGKKLSQALLKVGIDIRRKIFKTVLDELGGEVRAVISGAAALNKQVAEDFNAFGIYTVEGYGLTETAPVVAGENIHTMGHNSVGKPLCNVEVKIEDPNEEGIGEIAVKGPNVMLGYYENEEDTKAVLKDGWFYTGDLGYYNKKGYLCIAGRQKSVIVLKNGKNIYPEEIETLINTLPYVEESMVFGYPKGDDLIISAKIVYNKEYFKNTSKEDIEDKVWKDIKNINKELTIFKHIKKTIVTDEPMIKTTTAKVKRFEEIKKILQGN